jgi:putative oxidoreductase
MFRTPSSMLYPLYDYYDIGLLALRLAVAVIFLVHGPKKLSGTQGAFMTFIGAAETAGGAAMVAGFLTQYAALGLGIIMGGAIYKKIKEWHVPFTSMEKMGWEFDLMILAGCIALLTLGAGMYSVDAMWF